MYAPQIGVLMSSQKSPLWDVMIHFHMDHEALSRRYPVAFSPTTCRVFEVFYDEWAQQLQAIDYDVLDVAGRIDVHLLKTRMGRGRLKLAHLRETYGGLSTWLPFADDLIGLIEARIGIERLAPRDVGGTLSRISEMIRACARRLSEVSAESFDAVALRRFLEQLREHLERWYKECHGYDPELSWWIEKPYEDLKKLLDGYLAKIKEDVLGEKEGGAGPVTAKPMGREVVEALLRYEYISYTPDELFDIAERELTACEKEMGMLAEEMGYKGDRKAAVEHIKNRHAKPGDQPYVARELAEEAVRFLEEKDLVMIPAHAKRTWRQQMIDPDAQKGGQTFLYGGETIGTSYAHKAQTHQQKLSSMRSNNVPFLKATVHHELIPGHHLMMYMNDRYNTHRKGYGTPFLGEGWPLYWELLLYKLGFATTPEDRYGFLFWRMHRCARIMVVLGFHIGRLSIRDCLDLVITRVGHEETGGTAQVRWLIAGDLMLYGASYMLGGLQLMGLRKELVDSGKMSDRAFHDGILQANLMPIYLLRALLTGRRLDKDEDFIWPFYQDH